MDCPFHQTVDWETLPSLWPLREAKPSRVTEGSNAELSLHSQHPQLHLKRTVTMVKSVYTICVIAVLLEAVLLAHSGLQTLSAQNVEAGRTGCHITLE